VRTAHDTLAWALGEECGQTFAENFISAINELDRLGYLFVDAGVLTKTNPFRKPS
jgi:hypothetical protein